MFEAADEEEGGEAESGGDGDLFWFGDGLEITQDEIAGAEMPTQEAKGEFELDIEQPAWKEHIWHFGKHQGKKLGEFDRKVLYGLAKNYQPQPYNGRISPKDEELRAALDEALKYMEAKR